MAGKSKSLILGGGCFWCLEAIFNQVKGVNKVTNGYSGGNQVKPSYEQVCTGDTGHAEVIKIDYDPDVINLSQLLDIFFSIHDPTTLNRQGADSGTQYRSIIFYDNESDLKTIESSLKKAQLNWDDPIVTQIENKQEFYEAESYHQNYFANNPSQAYCQVIINPKLKHFRDNFQQYLK